MGLVETVACKFFHVLENQFRGFLGNPFCLGTFDEFGFRRLHLRDDFLTHCLAQTVRLAHRKSGKFTRNLHNLLLIDHKSVSFAQNLAQPRMIVNNFLLSVFSFDVVRNNIHRSRTVKCDSRDKILDAVRFHLVDHLFETSAFHLEYTLRAVLADVFVCRRVIKRYFGNVKIRFFLTYE